MLTLNEEREIDFDPLLMYFQVKNVALFAAVFVVVAVVVVAVVVVAVVAVVVGAVVDVWLLIEQQRMRK